MKKEVQHLSGLVYEEIKTKLGYDSCPTPANLKYKIRAIWGVEVTEDHLRAADPQWTGEVIADLVDDVTSVGTIFIRPGMPDDLQLRVLIHELAEFLCMRYRPSLYDYVDDPAFRALFDGRAAPRDLRHMAAGSIMETLSKEWRLDDLDPARAKQLRIDVALITANKWLLDNPPGLEIERLPAEEI